MKSLETYDVLRYIARLYVLRNPSNHSSKIGSACNVGDMADTSIRYRRVLRAERQGMLDIASSPFLSSTNESPRWLTITITIKSQRLLDMITLELL